MTLKTSLFNKGIYKSTIKRCLWGSVLYFVILFLTTTLPWLSDATFYTRFGENASYPSILGYNYLTFPLITTWFVPTIAGLLVFRFMHSKKTSVFTHSLPVSRNAIYFSSVLAGFTLIFLPVIANGVIIAVTSLGTFDLTAFRAALVWTGCILLGLFLMFSAASFAASLTGNSFAMIVINLLVHILLLSVVGLFGGVLEEYVLGFTSSNQLFDSLAEGNFPAQIMWFDYVNAWFSTGMPMVDVVGFIISAVCAVLFFLFGWALYKNRNLENAEDIAGFKVLNPIFKYLVTFLVTLLSCGADWNILTTVILTVVAYFGTEMLLKKSMKVWKSYKGLAVFAVIFLACMSYIVYGGFFGFEKRVPSPEKVEQAKFFSYYEDYFDDDDTFYQTPELVAEITELHRAIVTDDRYYSNVDHHFSGEYIEIEYIMKDGRRISREYNVPKSFFEKIRGFYKYEEFKEKNVGIIIGMNDAERYYTNAEINFTDKKKNCYIPPDRIKQLHRALYDDIMALDYDGIYHGKYMDCSVTISSALPNIRYFEDSIDIREGFTNTINWLRENGYME
ncbi:MAG: hypothetical protein IKW02_01475 [Clostridia bacterium]|nr:hypothetical protein [Clostridia bacterium]